MRKMKHLLATSVMAAAIASGTYAFFASPLVPSAEARWHDHPKLEKAFHALEDAKEYLQTSPENFHGHKEEAMRAVDAALHQLSIAAEEEEHRTSAEPAPLEHHPKLREARERLKDAREYLDTAKDDFRGHKEDAMKAVDEAIHQIDRCLEE